MLNYLDGYGRNEVTLNSSENLNKGCTVAMSDDYTVAQAADGEGIVGVCTYSEEGSASVLIKGYAEVPYSGEAPAVGYCKLSGNGAGGVKKDTNGRDILVVGIDEAASLCGIIL